MENKESIPLQKTFPVNKPKTRKESEVAAICSTQFQTQGAIDPAFKDPNPRIMKNSLSSPSVWQHHIDNQKRQVIEEPKPADTEAPKSCQRCPYVTYNSDVLELHIVKYHGLIYSCDKCSFKASTLDSLQNHQRRPCTQASLFCGNKCGSQYKNYDALERHQKVCASYVSTRKV